MSRPDRPDNRTHGAQHVLGDVVDASRDAAREARQTAREASREFRDGARAASREHREAAREASREHREAARESGREHREAAREAGRDARDALRDLARTVRSGGRPDTGEPGTRTRIQQVALELFTSNGYEATSLREIAERLGVTKAALYYHFKTKDEIIQSLVDDQVAMVDELIKWAELQPRTRQAREEFLRRYSSMLRDGNHFALMRFFERNQSSMHKHKGGSQMRERITRMTDVLTKPEAPLPDQIRCALAVFALHSTWLTVRDPRVSEEERRQAALDVALSLVD
jgi:AcrR family transcriptional regulator/vacuolar-type H+-ATPase subunit H